MTSSGGEAIQEKTVSSTRKPATSPARYERSVPAPLFKWASKQIDGDVSAEPAASALGANELALALVELLKLGKGDHDSATRPSWTQRRVLVCTAPAHRETVARGLSGNGYEIFVAEDTQQAVERMRQSQLDVVILDPDFDAVEQGAAFVTRDVNVRRPAERRRLFFVLLSSSKRTMDTHSAFLQNVNLAVNFNELADLPEILDHSVREFNELYKDFNLVLNVAPL